MSSTELQPAPQIPVPTEDKWLREQRAFRQLLPGLLATLREQYVAIHEGKVVEHGPDKLEVANRAYARFGYVPIFVSRVTDELIAPERIPSPRLGRSKGTPLILEANCANWVIRPMMA
jgi:hypothetical protein